MCIAAGYCNFAVVAGRDDLVEPYLEALGTELAWLEQPREVDTLYFGGGTPTFLPAEQLKHLCKLGAGVASPGTQLRMDG